MSRSNLSPVFVQQRQRFSGWRLQREGQAADFADGNPTLHHVVCSGDSKGPNTQEKQLRHNNQQTQIPHQEKAFTFLLYLPRT